MISVIDDDPSVRIASENLLTSLGYIGHTFSSAEEFLHSADLKNTSCVITDVQMPGMSGEIGGEVLEASSRAVQQDERRISRIAGLDETRL